MVMAERDDVRTASLPVTVVDAVALSGQMLAALARLPFRRPFAGGSTARANLGTNLTREVVRSFISNASGLPIEEFRSIEHLVDDICGVVFAAVGAGDRCPAAADGPRWGTWLDVRRLGPAPGRRHPLPARRRLHRYVTAHVRRVRLAAVPRDRMRGVRRRLSARAGVPLPGWARRRRRRPHRPPRKGGAAGAVAHCR